MPTSTPLTLSRAARAELESLARSHRGRADEARRARIILLLSRRTLVLDDLRARGLHAADDRDLESTV